MVVFTVAGPHVVPVYKGKKGCRIVRSEEGDAFFRTHHYAAKKRGCYVFAIRAAGGLKPVYVGKATKTFKQECFTAHKLGKCNEALADCGRGTLVLFLIEAPSGQHRPPSKQITLVEDFFIQAGVAVNGNLLNIKGKKQAEWSVKGVIRPTKGPPTLPARALKKAFRFKK